MSSLIAVLAGLQMPRKCMAGNCARIRCVSLVANLLLLYIMLARSLYRSTLVSLRNRRSTVGINPTIATRRLRIRRVRQVGL